MKEHGTRSRYNNQGCRCDACKKASSEYMRQRKGPGRPPIGHGLSLYAQGRCRCDVCRKANAESQRQRRAVRKEQEYPGEHGVSAYGNWGCRCDTCKGAWSISLRSHRQRQRDAIMDALREAVILGGAERELSARVRKALNAHASEPISGLDLIFAVAEEEGLDRAVVQGWYWHLLYVKDLVIGDDGKVRSTRVKG